MTSARVSTSTSIAALCALAALLAGPAAAQTAPAPSPATGPAAAAPPADELPPPPPPPSYAEPTASGECTPACRSGFTCQAGQCVSACNPACGAGEQCTPQGECVAAPSSSYGAPSFPVPEDMGPPPHREGVEQHDGLMLRLAIGFGGGAASIDPEGNGAGIVDKFDFSGGGGAFSLDIGGAPVDNFVIHLRVSDFVMFGPKVKVSGGLASGSGELDGSLGSELLGLGFTYYFMPINLYLTAALGAGWLVLDPDTSDSNDSQSTDAGFGLNFDVGKEWWVSDNWGLGLAGRFVMVSGTTTDDDTDVKSAFGLAAFNLLFSATYQ